MSEFPNNERIFIEQAKVIEDLANSEDCIIIGRCSNVILKNREDVINIFIYASDIDFKIQRKMKYANGENEAEVLKQIQRTDQERANYYNYFTQKEWGNREDFDLMIDTSKIGVEKTVQLIKEYIKLKTNN